MKQQFKLKKEGYYKAIKQRLLTNFLATFLSIFMVLGMFYFLDFDFQKNFTWASSWYLLPGICVYILLQLCSGLRRIKVNYQSYEVIFEEEAILLKQLGHYEPLFFFIPSFGIDKRRIPYKEITAIRKSKTEYYTIKGEENSYPNTLLISAQIEDNDALEEILCEIKPIIPHEEVPDIKEYLVSEIAIKNQWKQFFNFKTISIILGSYLLALGIAYFWFASINSNLILFLSMATFIFFYGLIYFFLKKNNPKSPVIIDKTAIIIEQESGHSRAILLKEITAIKKNSSNLLVYGKAINFAHNTFMIIPKTLQNFENLEQKLNANL